MILKLVHQVYIKLTNCPVKKTLEKVPWTCKLAEIVEHLFFASHLIRLGWVFYWKLRWQTPEELKPWCILYEGLEALLWAKSHMAEACDFLSVTGPWRQVVTCHMEKVLLSIVPYTQPRVSEGSYAKLHLHQPRESQLLKLQRSLGSRLGRVVQTTRHCLQPSKYLKQSHRVSVCVAASVQGSWPQKLWLMIFVVAMTIPHHDTFNRRTKVSRYNCTQWFWCSLICVPSQDPEPWQATGTSTMKKSHASTKSGMESKWRSCCWKHLEAKGFQWFSARGCG